MNTPRDTDEGRARPSVWPVYVAAVVVLLISAGYIVRSGGVLLASVDIEQPWAEIWVSRAFLAFLAYGLFGVITAIGMLRLRPWAWWCALVFVPLWLLSSNVGVSLHDGTLTVLPPTHYPAYSAVCLVVFVLLMVVLATRRQLFFPPKPEDEE